MKVDLYPDERLDYLLGNKIQLIQSDDSFAFSLDTILLAFIASQQGHLKRVADLCAGNGAASLYLSVFNEAHYDLVEIQAKIADRARRSVLLNNLSDRFQVFQQDVKNAYSFLKKDRYDAVICNPPYFRVDHGQKINPNQAKAIARHEIMIDLPKIVEISAGLLKMKGKFFLVHRPERLPQIMQLFLENDLAMKSIQPFLPKKGMPANLIIVTGVKSGRPDGLVIQPDQIVHHDDGTLTTEMEEIYRGQ